MQWFTTGVSTTLVLILLGIVSFFILFAQRLSDSVKENLTVTVLLDGEASRSDIHEFRTALKGERYVYALDYVSKEQALKEQVKAMGSDPSEFLGANPFTASFELRMNALYANSDSLAWITAKLKKNPLVEDVMYQKELVDTVNDNLRRISYVLLGLLRDADVKISFYNFFCSSGDAPGDALRGQLPAQDVKGCEEHTQKQNIQKRQLRGARQIFSGQCDPQIIGQRADKQAHCAAYQKSNQQEKQDVVIKPA